MKKIITVIAGIILVALAAWYFWGSNNPSTEPVEEITILNPVGPAVIPVAGITSGEIACKTPLKVHFWKNIDEAIALLARNEAQFAVLPVTTAANLYAQDTDISLLGVHEWKVFYLVAREGTQYEGWQSLKDKTVYTPVARGQTVDVLMRSALEEQGISPDNDVTINYAPPQEIVALFKEGKIDYAALPEPFVTLAISENKGNIVLDFQKYWGETTNSPERLPIAGLFVKRDFMKNYPKETEEVVKAFTASVQWANNNIDQALNETKEILPLPPAVMKTALTRIDFYYTPAKTSQKEVHNYLSELNRLYPAGIKKLPDKEFYAQ